MNRLDEREKQGSVSEIWERQVRCGCYCSRTDGPQAGLEDNRSPCSKDQEAIKSEWVCQSIQDIKDWMHHQIEMVGWDGDVNQR